MRGRDNVSDLLPIYRGHEVAGLQPGVEQDARGALLHRIAAVGHRQPEFVEQRLRIVLDLGAILLERGGGIGLRGLVIRGGLGHGGGGGV